MDISESLLNKLTYNQQVLVNALANKPEGILSRELTHKTGLSNKSELVNSKLITLLTKEGLEIHLERVTRQWIWVLRPINAAKKTN